MIAFIQKYNTADLEASGGGAHSFYVGESPVECLLTKAEEIDNPYTKQNEQPRKVVALWYVVTSGQYQHTEGVDYFDFTTPEVINYNGRDLEISKLNYSRFHQLAKAAGFPNGSADIRNIEDVLNRKVMIEHKTTKGKQKTDANNMPQYKADGTPDCWEDSSTPRKYKAVPQVASAPQLTNVAPQQPVAPQAPVQPAMQPQQMQQPVQYQPQPQPVQLDDEIPFN